MKLELKLQRLGSQTFRNYLIDDTAFLPAKKVKRPHEYVLYRINGLLNQALKDKTYTRLPIKSRGTGDTVQYNLIKIYPSNYKVCTIEWKDS